MARDGGETDGTTSAHGRPRLVRGWAWCIRWRGRLAVLGALVVVAAAIVGWVRVPELYVGVHDESARMQAIVTTRASVLAALAGLGALVTIGINYRNSRTQLRNAEVASQTLATTQETFRVTERGHLTDRYAKAIEQLGNETSIAIRLGGIYALQQLAVDTGRDSDQAAVVEVLSAFVRLNLRAGLPELSDAIASAPEETAGDQTQRQTQQRLAPAEPRADVLATISVLAQLPKRPGASMRADFTGLDFTGITLTHARLAGADLTHARLAGADLTRADLTGADLSNADLTGADLSNANLTGADLTGTDLDHADLGGAALDGAALVRAFLPHADLTSADLTHAVLDGAVLQGAVLVGADFRGADLDGADLADARLTYGNPTGVRVDDFVGLSDEQLESMRRRPDGSSGSPNPGRPRRRTVVIRARKRG